MVKPNSQNSGPTNTRRQNPKAAAAMILALPLVFVAVSCWLVTVDAAAASKSGYTQAHGLSRSATVTSVANNTGKAPSADIAVRLGEPVDGQAATTAHVHNLSSLKPGATVRVLVDPKDPGYAEFPGQRYTPESTAWVGAATCLGSFSLFAAMAIWWIRVYRKRMRMQAAEAAPNLNGLG